mmetsp:Transcript_32593/g.45487  ORF Transcript_32593/g.45487 Transcript_32593/m.45487 type:complete len:251 (+) Transcript_32593:232-984(+)
MLGFTSTLTAFLTVCVGCVALRHTSLGPRLRCWFTSMPLGLRNSRRKKHAILDLSRFESVDQFVASLPRSPRRTLTKARTLDCALRLQVVYPWDIGHEHLTVAIDHELRAMPSQTVACVAGLFRTLVACLMLGEVVEYRENTNGRLVAWAMTVCKGNTVRGQWFYQRTEWSKKMIWFHSIIQAIEHVISERKSGSQLRWVDVGPSTSSQVEVVKQKLGFLVTEEWQNDGFCDYSGEYSKLYNRQLLKKQN